MSPDFLKKRLSKDFPNGTITVSQEWYSDEYRYRVEYKESKSYGVHKWRIIAMPLYWPYAQIKAELLKTIR